ncbi:MAG TPA: DUF1501 domain-containing protein [Planctomycetaceae bacterium]|nr:DUF1501 domain-containing protein [Planctomycetaceae bacterium]
MAVHRTCDGMQRRDFLRVGVLGTSAVTLANYLQWSQAAEATGAKAKSAIFINLAGGPTHLDTFDMKPNSPSEYRGEFNPIQTNIPGIEISEHLPKLAQSMDKFVILRGITHSLAAHELGSQYVNTGNRPIPSLEFPGYGAVISKELGGPEELPANVAIPNTAQKTGYLGVRYAALSTGSTPKAGQPYSVRGVSLGGGLTVTEVERRQNLLSDLDQTFRAVEKDSQLLDGLDRFSEQAHTIITSRRARDAFNTALESPSFAEPFGDTPFGQSCLLASRLVESGVRFVTIQNGGWDTHNDGWTRLKNNLLPPLDAGLSALLNGLHQKGLLESTAVFVTGEFGRTPKINTQRVGRDHYARAMFMLMAGGGVKPGRVIGASDEKGLGPVGDGHSPDDVAASFYHNLGIDPKKEYQTNIGRPVMIVRDGNVIPELFA